MVYQPNLRTTFGDLINKIYFNKHTKWFEPQLRSYQCLFNKCFFLLSGHLEIICYISASYRFIKTIFRPPHEKPVNTKKYIKLVDKNPEAARHRIYKIIK